jgi:hypothetical protein
MAALAVGGAARLPYQAGSNYCSNIQLNGLTYDLSWWINKYANILALFGLRTLNELRAVTATDPSSAFANIFGRVSAEAHSPSRIQLFRIRGLLPLAHLWTRHVPIHPVARKLQRVARLTAPSLVKHG